MSSDGTDLLFPRPHHDFRIEESVVSFDVDTGESSYSGSPERKERRKRGEEGERSALGKRGGELDDSDLLRAFVGLV